MPARELRLRANSPFAGGEEREEVDDELDEEGRMKFEVERARERATLKHKNTGKWAKAMQQRGDTMKSSIKGVGLKETESSRKAGPRSLTSSRV